MVAATLNHAKLNLRTGICRAAFYRNGAQTPGSNAAEASVTTQAFYLD